MNICSNMANTSNNMIIIINNTINTNKKFQHLNYLLMNKMKIINNMMKPYNWQHNKLQQHNEH